MPEISFTCTAEDEAWIKAQAEELGIDDIGMTVRIIVRDARKRGVGFGIVASGNPWRDALPVMAAGLHTPSRQWTKFAPLAQEAARTEPQRAEDFELPAESGDEVADILAEGASAVDAMLHSAQAQSQAPELAPASSYRSRAAAYRGTTAIPQPMDGRPGSRTNVVAIGDLERLDPRSLAPRDQVAQTNLKRQLDGHFGNLRRA